MHEGEMGYNWKSSPWLLLFGGVAQEDETPRGKTEMGKVAEKLKVRLVWVEDGWKFRERFDGSALRGKESAL